MMIRCFSFFVTHPKGGYLRSFIWFEIMAEDATLNRPLLDLATSHSTQICQQHACSSSTPNNGLKEQWTC